MPSNFITEPCTLRLRVSGATDAYGNETATFTDVTTVCSVQQTSTLEPEEQGETASSDWAAFFQPGEAMGNTPTGNTVVVNGATYQFTGKPWRVWSPWDGAYSHWQVKVQEAG